MESRETLSTGNYGEKKQQRKKVFFGRSWALRSLGVPKKNSRALRPNE